MPNMASSTTLFVLSYIFMSILFFHIINAKFAEHSAVAVSAQRMQKMTRLHFYFHDTVAGQDPTAMRIAGPKDGRSFGSTFMMDDPLTERPDLASKLVGRAQGLYALASHNDVGLLMVSNFAFVDGAYNGSALSILGRNSIFDTVRELPIIGGSGLFRFARGYALAKTVSFNQKTHNAVVEYNVSIIHF